MPSQYICHQYFDWSEIAKDESIWGETDLIDAQLRYGIHPYDGKLWTSGFVGVGRILKRNGHPYVCHGKQHLLEIRSRFGINPWKMFETVLADDEFETYSSEVEARGDFFFKVFWDQELIPVNFNNKIPCDLLCAFSFVNNCYSVCKKGLKRSMVNTCGNYISKVKGRIDIKQNIRINTFRGRNDRFFCQHIDFSEDNTENRIIKAALSKCTHLIQNKYPLFNEFNQRIAFCNNVLKHVSNVPVSCSDFHSVSIAGLYLYYKPLLALAKLVFNEKFFLSSITSEKKSKTCLSVPYLINMELIFEFYVRSILKKHLKNSNFEVVEYAKKIFLEKNISNMNQILHGVHLIPYCIPDIIIKDRMKQKVVSVFDAKYKFHDRTNREDSLQLLTYALLTGATKCGFIFPGQTTELKNIRGQGFAELNSPIHPLSYCEILLNEDCLDEKTIQFLFLRNVEQ